MLPQLYTPEIWILLLQVTKLVENYRSHKMLLRLYSDQFYDGELVEKADHRITHSLCNGIYLPTKGVPLIFFMEYR